MPVIRHRAVQVSGLKLFVRTAGDPVRPTLVLLHGFPSSSRHYVRLLDRLAGHWHVWSRQITPASAVPDAEVFLLDTGHLAKHLG